MDVGRCGDATLVNPAPTPDMGRIESLILVCDRGIRIWDVLLCRLIVVINIKDKFTDECDHVLCLVQHSEDGAVVNDILTAGLFVRLSATRDSSCYCSLSCNSSEEVFGIPFF